MKAWKKRFTHASFQTLLMNNFEFLENADLKDFCTFHIGGKAKFLYITYSTSSLINVCYKCETHNIKYKVIGSGSNLLFDDFGFDGAIIVNKSSEIYFENDMVWADAGVNLTSLILNLKQHGFGNFESLIGIPSSVGGGIVNNVGAFGVELGDYVRFVEVRKKTDLFSSLYLSHDDCKFVYRGSIFKCQDYIITRVCLNILKKDTIEIETNITESISKKTSTQPLDCFSAGSIFKRGNIIPAKVIDELGMKGFSIGGAEISKKHAGFIVNNGNATSKDVKNLIKIMSSKVYSHTGELIEPEIEFVEP